MTALCYKRMRWCLNKEDLLSSSGVFNYRGKKKKKKKKGLWETQRTRSLFLSLLLGKLVVFFSFFFLLCQ